MSSDACTVLTQARLRGWDFTYEPDGDRIVPHKPIGATRDGFDLMREQIRAVRNAIVCRLIVEQWMQALPAGGFDALSDEACAAIITVRDAGDVAGTRALCGT